MEEYKGPVFDPKPVPFVSREVQPAKAAEPTLKISSPRIEFASLETIVVSCVQPSKLPTPKLVQF